MTNTLFAVAAILRLSLGNLPHHLTNPNRSPSTHRSLAPLISSIAKIIAVNFQSKMTFRPNQPLNLGGVVVG